MTETILRLENVRKTFPGVLANDDVNLEIKTGEIHALLGENGAGKTTLMNCLYGVYRPDGGKIFWKGTLLSKQTTALPILESSGHGIVTCGDKTITFWSSRAP